MHRWSELIRLGGSSKTEGEDASESLFAEAGDVADSAEQLC
jgi:hypothetical protein